MTAGGGRRHTRHLRLLHKFSSIEVFSFNLGVYLQQVRSKVRELRRRLQLELRQAIHAPSGGEQAPVRMKKRLSDFAHVNDDAWPTWSW
jgi:hypothetical protein